MFSLSFSCFPLEMTCNDLLSKNIENPGFLSNAEEINNIENHMSEVEDNCASDINKSLIYIAIADFYRIKDINNRKSFDYYSKAIKLKNIPNGIYIHAQTAMAYSLLNGHGVDKNIKEAIGHFNKAERVGGLVAKAFIGVSKFYGMNGFKKNEKEGFEMIKPAADAGHVIAASVVGRAYSSGAGTLINDKKSFKYNRIAAMGGDILSQKFLSAQYAIGKGVDVDDISAYAWQSIVLLGSTSDKESEESKILIEEVSKSMSMEDINKAQELSEKLLVEINENIKKENEGGYY